MSDFGQVPALNLLSGLRAELTLTLFPKEAGMLVGETHTVIQNSWTSPMKLQVPLIWSPLKLKRWDKHLCKGTLKARGQYGRGAHTFLHINCSSEDQDVQKGNLRMPFKKGYSEAGTNCFW